MSSLSDGPFIAFTLRGRSVTALCDPGRDQTFVSTRFARYLQGTGRVYWFETPGRYAAEVWCPMPWFVVPPIRAVLWPLPGVGCVLGADALARLGHLLKPVGEGAGDLGRVSHLSGFHEVPDGVV